MAQISKEENMIELADKCLILAKSDATAKELMLKFIEIRPEIGEKDVKIHVHHVKHKTDYFLYTDEEWQQLLDRTNIHVSRMIEGEEMFESIGVISGPSYKKHQFK